MEKVWIISHPTASGGCGKFLRSQNKTFSSWQMRRSQIRTMRGQSRGTLERLRTAVPGLPWPTRDT